MKALRIKARRILTEYRPDTYQESDYITFETPEDIFLFLRDTRYIIMLIGNNINDIIVLVDSDTIDEYNKIKKLFLTDDDVLNNNVILKGLTP